MFNYLKPYAIFLLKDAKEETHCVIDNNHYEFSNVIYHDSVEGCMNQYDDLIAKGKKCIVITAAKVEHEFIHNEMMCMKNELGIDDVNYYSKQ